jgi:WD40 repeat protein
MILWDIKTGAQLHVFAGHEGPMQGIAFSPDGKLIASTSLDMTIRIWDTATGKELKQFKTGGDFFSNPLFTPDGKALAVASTTGWNAGSLTDIAVRLLDVDNGKEIRRFTGHTNLIQGIAISPDGRKLLSGSSDATVRVWDLTSGKEILRFAGHDRLVAKVRFSADGQFAWSRDNALNLLIWDVYTGQILRRFDASVTAAVFTMDSQSIYLANVGSHTIRLWTLSLSLPELLTWAQQNRYVRDLNCSERDLYHVEPICSVDDLISTQRP